MIIAIPMIITDVKNDKEIKEMYKSYINENKKTEYKDKTKTQK